MIIINICIIINIFRCIIYNEFRIFTCDNIILQSWYFRIVSHYRNICRDTITTFTAPLSSTNTLISIKSTYPIFSFYKRTTIYLCIFNPIKGLISRLIETKQIWNITSIITSSPRV